jgi:flavin reductase (DIM6/NTAB) family NADH-FMN oxidoreductase RutF
LIYIDPSKNSELENYKLLIGSIIPRPIAFVTTKSLEGVVNGAPFSFFNIVASDPPLISIAVQRKNKFMKDTSVNITKTKEFVVHIVDVDNVVEINKTARSLEYNESEIAYTNLNLIESTKIKVPGIKEAKVRMECKLEQLVSFENSDLIIARVLAFHFSDDIYEKGKINPEKLAAISRLAGQSYGKIGEIFEIERPK